jgi:hypothetical protein
MCRPPTFTVKKKNKKNKTKKNKKTNKCQFVLFVLFSVTNSTNAGIGKRGGVISFPFHFGAIPGIGRQCQSFS